MKKFKVLFVSLIFLLVYFSASAWAGSSGDDLLNACKQALQTSSFQTQHLVYKTTLVMTQGTQAPVTNVQTIEIYKKLPNYMKMTTDNGYNKQTIITNGGYAYIQDPGTGKFVPVKGLAPSNPFQSLTQSLSTNFATATVNTTDANTSEITVTGGKLPKFVDHAMIRVDSPSHTITHMEGVDSKGNQVLNMDMTYQKIGTATQLKHFDSQSSYKNISVNTTMDVLTNEINQNVDNSVFAGN